MSRVNATPDIVLFMVDQLAAKWLEAASAGACPTPNFDRLRASGTTFTRAHASNPLCCPCRASIATGMTTRGHGVLQNGYQLSPELPTFMRALQQAGYRTGALGKVHFHPHFTGTFPDYRPYGFDVCHITEDVRGGEWHDWVQREHPDHYEASLTDMWALSVPEFEAFGDDCINLRDRVKAVREKWPYKSDAFPHDTPQRHTLQYPEPISQTAWITMHACDFIASTPREQRLFAQVSYVQPHSPFIPPGDCMSLVDVHKLPQAVGTEWVDDPLGPVCFRESFANWQTHLDEAGINRHYYFADIAHLDQQLGKVVDALKAAGRFDNTVIVFLSDHGEMLGDHGMRSKGEFHYDACTRVPLMIAGPGLTAGQTCDRIVQLEDIYPTMLDLAGLTPATPRTMGPYLKDPPLPGPGRSLLPLCRGESISDWRDAAYIESYNNLQSCRTRFWARTVQTDTWRYTMYPGGSGEQLFDLANDPNEQHNLAGSADHAVVRRGMRDRLLEAVILQDHPHTPRDLFAIGVH